MPCLMHGIKRLRPSELLSSLGFVLFFALYFLFRVLAHLLLCLTPLIPLDPRLSHNIICSLSLVGYAKCPLWIMGVIYPVESVVGLCCLTALVGGNMGNVGTW